MTRHRSTLLTAAALLCALAALALAQHEPAAPNRDDEAAEYLAACEAEHRACCAGECEP